MTELWIISHQEQMEALRRDFQKYLEILTAQGQKVNFAEEDRLWRWFRENHKFNAKAIE